MTVNPMKVIGERIAVRRKELELTQEQLAKIIGKQRTSVANIEAGRQNLTIKTLLALCAALEITPSELFDGIQMSNTVYKRASELRQEITRLQSEMRALLGK